MHRLSPLFLCFVSVLCLSLFAVPSQGQTLKYRDGSTEVIGGQDPTLNRVNRSQDAATDFFDLDRHVEEAVMLARPVYQEIGQPRVVLYMNQVFSQNVTDFFVTKRESVTVNSDVVGIVGDTDVNFQANETVSTQTEMARQRENPYVRPAQVFTSKFKAGVSRTLRRVPMKQVDQSAIQRLAAGDAEPTSMSVHEMQALEQYADYLAEFLFVNDGESVVGFSVEMRLIRLSDGLLVGMDIFEPSILGETEEYEVTANGFESVIYQDIPTAYGVGEGSGATLLNLLTDSRSIL